MSGGNASLASRPDRGLDRIRADLDERIAWSGLRSVAREVGMSPSGLQKVLAGSQPYRQTLVKLRAWHERHVAGDSRTAEDLALETLLMRVPEARRDQARRQIRAILDGGGTGG